LTALLADLRLFHKTRNEALLKSSDAYKLTIKALDKLRQEIKSKVKALESDVATRSKNSKSDLENLHSRSKDLNDAIVGIKSGSGTPKHDPSMLKITLEKALEIAREKQGVRENEVIAMRVECGEFEASMIEKIKGVLGNLAKGTSESMKALGGALSLNLASIDASVEGRMFADSQRSVSMSKETPFPSFDYGLDDPLARVVKSAEMKRQKAIIKSSFTDCFVLLVFLSD
jgi:hypothetical protein